MLFRSRNDFPDLPGDPGDHEQRNERDNGGQHSEDDRNGDFMGSVDGRLEPRLTALLVDRKSVV